MKKKIKIICTLGPKSLNKEFLKFSKNKISLLRLNISHLSLSNLVKSIKFIKKYTKIPICIDTEGAQIRTGDFESSIFLKQGALIKIHSEDINKYKINYIIHLAAQAGVRYSLENPYAYMESNLVGFLNIIELCRHEGVEGLVYASSSSIYLHIQGFFL